MRLNVEVVHCVEDLNMMRPAMPWAGDFLGCLAVGKKRGGLSEVFFFLFWCKEKKRRPPSGREQECADAGSLGARRSAEHNTKNMLSNLEQCICFYTASNM